MESFPNIPAPDHTDSISKYFPIFPKIRLDTPGIKGFTENKAISYHDIFVCRSKQRHQEIQDHNSGHHEINRQHKSCYKIIFRTTNEFFLEEQEKPGLINDSMGLSDQGLFNKYKNDV